MTFDSVSLYFVATSSDRARARSAILRQGAAADRQWLRRPTRLVAWRRLGRP